MSLAALPIGPQPTARTSVSSFSTSLIGCPRDQLAHLPDSPAYTAPHFFSLFLSPHIQPSCALCASCPCQMPNEKGPFFLFFHVFFSLSTPLRPVNTCRGSIQQHNSIMFSHGQLKGIEEGKDMYIICYSHGFFFYRVSFHLDIASLRNSTTTIGRCKRRSSRVLKCWKRRNCDGRFSHTQFSSFFFLPFVPKKKKRECIKSSNIFDLGAYAGI